MAAMSKRDASGVFETFQQYFNEVFSLGPFKSLVNERPEPAEYVKGRYGTCINNDGIELYVDLPGVDPATVTVEATDSVVTVTGKRPKGGMFAHRYTMSGDYRPHLAAARMANGRLHVQMPRAEATVSRPTAIPVSRA